MSQTKYTLEELFENHKKWNNVATIDIVTMYTEEALKNKETFLKFLQIMYTKYPWVIKAFIMGAPNSVYSIKELFKDNIKLLSPAPRYKYGSQTINQFIITIESYMKNRYILSDEGQKKILFLASDILSSDDYKIFEMILKNEFNPKIYKYFKELYDEQNLPIDIGNKFLYSISLDGLEQIPNDLFVNDTNTELMYLPKSELKFYLVFNNIIYTLNKNKKLCIQNVPDNIQNFINTINIKYVSVPIILLFDGESCIAQFNHNTHIFFGEVSQLSERMLAHKLCTGISSMIMIKQKENHYYISGCISYDNNTITKVTKIADSFTITKMPFIGMNYSVISCKSKDGDFSVLALSDTAEKIGKNTKNFKLASLCGNYYYMG